MRLIIPFLLLIGLLWVSVQVDSSYGRADLTTVNTGAIRTLDPQHASWNTDIRMVNALFEGLCSYDLATMKPSVGIAESWGSEESNRVWTFKLRKNAKWSNGDPITANDFLFSWRMALMQENSSSYTFFMWNLKGGEAFYKWSQESLADLAKEADGDEAKLIELGTKRLAESESKFNELVKVSASDDYTLRIELETPVPYFLDIVAFPTYFPIHRPSIEASCHIDPKSGWYIRDAAWTQPERIVCNGAFVPRDWKFKREILLTKNAEYWNTDAVSLNSIRFLNIEDNNAAFVAYETGTLDLIIDGTSIPYSADLIKQAQPGVDGEPAKRNDIHNAPLFGTYYYRFNCREKLPDGRDNPLHDARVRKALVMTVDKQAIVENVTRLHQTVTGSFVPHGAVPGYTPTEGLPYDPDQARKLLAEAGYPNGEGMIPLNFLYNTGGRHEVTAQAIKSMWEKELNVTIELQGQELKVMSDRRDRGEFTILRAGWIGDYGDPTTFLDLLMSDNSHNTGGYSDSHYDSLLEEAAIAPDPAERFRLLQEAEHHAMVNQAPILPIYNYNTIHIFNPDKLSGVSLHPRSLQIFSRMRITK